MDWYGLLDGGESTTKHDISHRRTEVDSRKEKKVIQQRVDNIRLFSPLVLIILSHVHLVI